MHRMYHFGQSVTGLKLQSIAVQGWVTKHLSYKSETTCRELADFLYVGRWIGDAPRSVLGAWLQLVPAQHQATQEEGRSWFANQVQSCCLAVTSLCTLPAKLRTLRAAKSRFHNGCEPQAPRWTLQWVSRSYAGQPVEVTCSTPEDQDLRL